MSLVEFLLARIAEDEAVEAPLANADTRSALREGSRDYIEVTPARVLAECEVKRRIVGRHDVVDVTGGCAFCGEPAPCEHLRLLALPYADHEDYREEWKL